MSYEVLKLIHLFGMVLLLGAGGASAFYKYVTDKSDSLEMIVHMNKLVVLADWLFTTPAIIIQPISGIALMHMLGYTFSTWWIELSLILYTFSTLLWFGAVYLQMKMKDIANEANSKNQKLPKLYYKYARIWFFLGFPSFFAMLSIVLLMIFKTNFSM
jgi:uncharacterized membrane protein